jgi:antitoxin (DNA-binding transcriptional repressor) of toxin-antitoxin stability system
LVDRAAAGEEIIIAKGGRPMARLVALAPARTGPQRVGRYGHLITVGEDFDDPLPEDLQRAFDGKMP